MVLICLVFICRILDNNLQILIHEETNIRRRAAEAPSRIHSKLLPLPERQLLDRVLSWIFFHEITTLRAVNGRYTDCQGPEPAARRKPGRQVRGDRQLAWVLSRTLLFPQLPPVTKHSSTVRLKCPSFAVQAGHSFYAPTPTPIRYLPITSRENKIVALCWFLSLE